jgi:mono/diheme cytochrome c family protein
MNTKHTVLAVVVIVVLGICYFVFAPPAVGDAQLPTGPEALARGLYIYNAGGCGACHQVEGATAPIGGYEIESPFGGKFHVPNITPDPQTGIGGWTGKDFLRALKHGRKPGGGFYWPAFPYRSYKDMTDQDALDVGAYLMSLPPVNHKVPPHDLPVWQFSFMMSVWNIMADFLEGTPPAVSNDPQMQRGAYLARTLGHCGECHTPRNVIGMMQRNHEFEGSTIVTKQIDVGTMSAWSSEDFVALLQLGLTKDFDVVSGEMAAVVEHTKLLTPEDQAAYAAFFTRGGATASSSAGNKD